MDIAIRLPVTSSRDALIAINWWISVRRATYRVYGALSYCLRLSVVCTRSRPASDRVAWPILITISDHVRLIVHQITCISCAYDLPESNSCFAVVTVDRGMLNWKQKKQESCIKNIPQTSQLYAVRNDQIIISDKSLGLSNGAYVHCTVPHVRTARICPGNRRLVTSKNDVRIRRQDFRPLVDFSGLIFKVKLW